VLTRTDAPACTPLSHTEQPQRSARVTEVRDCDIQVMAEEHDEFGPAQLPTIARVLVRGGGKSVPTAIIFCLLGRAVSERTNDRRTPIVHFCRGSQ
jgi:hypothetical protein